MAEQLEEGGNGWVIEPARSGWAWKLSFDSVERG
jgi:hypothetical protein